MSEMTKKLQKCANVNEQGVGSKHNHWPEGVVQEILVRLPIKSILRFKSTCKNWYSLITSRSFIEFHRQFHVLDDHRHQLFIFKSGVISSLSPPHFSQSIPLFDLGQLWKSLTIAKIGLNSRAPPLVATKVLGPLNNGIYSVVFQVLAFTYAPPNSFQNYFHSNAAICNPATREFKLLAPFVTVSDYGDADHAIHLGFGCVHKPGRGQTVVDYKMIVIKQHRESNAVTASVYSLRRGSWKEIRDSRLVDQTGELPFPEIIQDYRFSGHAFLNGGCHWMAGVSDHEYSVLRLDMTTEVFGLMAGPPNVEGDRSGVLVLNDRLATMFSADGPNEKVNIHVWLMMEYGFEKSWTKIHSCEFYLQGCELATFLGMSLYSSTEDRRRGFSTIKRMFFDDNRRNLISCDRSSFRTHCKFDSSLDCWKTLGLSGYIETLERVDVELEDIDEEDTSSS